MLAHINKAEEGSLLFLVQVELVNVLDGLEAELVLELLEVLDLFDGVAVQHEGVGTQPQLLQKGRDHLNQIVGEPQLPDDASSDLLGDGGDLVVAEIDLGALGQLPEEVGHGCELVVFELKPGEVAEQGHLGGQLLEEVVGEVDPEDLAQLTDGRGQLGYAAVAGD